MLAFIQSEFASALLDPDRRVPHSVTSRTSASPTKRFGVYRNNVVVSLVGALRTRFPVVEKIVGEEFFAAMARLFVTGNPPRSPLLMTYGDAFADFIEHFEPAAELPYLPGVARLEAARTKAFHADDAEPADPRSLLQLDPNELAAASFTLHPSMQIVRSKHPIVTIWAMNSGEAELQPIECYEGEDALVIRPNLEVTISRLPRGGADLLASLAAGRHLADAAERAVAEHPDFDLAANLAGLLRAGGLTGVILPNRSQTP